MEKYIKTIDGIEVYFEALEEFMHPKDLFMAEDVGEICFKIDRGMLTWFCAKVTAKKAGIELATEYLGGCCYEHENDFILNGYFDDLANEVVNQAKTQIPIILEKLSK